MAPAHERLDARERPTAAERDLGLVVDDELAAPQRVVELRLRAQRVLGAVEQAVVVARGVASAALRAVHRGIGLAQQPLGRVLASPVATARRRSSRAGKTSWPASHSGSQSAAESAPARSSSSRRVVDVLAQHGELVTAEARHGVAARRRCGGAGRRPRRSSSSPACVAERVVDELEAVEVEEQQPDAQARRRGAVQRGLRALEQQRAVRQPGQRVAHGEDGEPALDLLALDGVADRRAQQRPGRLALDEVVLRAGADRLDGDRVLAEAGEDHDRRARGDVAHVRRPTPGRARRGA